MRPGTPGFVGARLREAREARGVTAVSLAEMVGVSRQVVSKYEMGERSPSPDVLARMAALLRFPTEFFLQTERAEDGSTIFYRSLAAATKTARSRGDRRIEWLADITTHLMRYVEFPEVTIPSLATTPEEAAAAVREIWGLGDAPINHMVWLIENHGGIITRGETGAHTIDAFSRWHGIGRPLIFLGSDKESAVRSRFDAAHELGHMILHRDVERRKFSKPEHFRELEDEAHAFASAFLLPASPFIDDLWKPTLDAMRVLKSKWGASIAAMIVRARDLAIIGEDYEQRLWASLGRRGWRRREPLDDVIEVEQPRLIRRAIELIVDERVVSRDAILAALALDSRDLEELASLPEGYLWGSDAPVRLLDRAVPSRPIDTGERGAVVSFPIRDPIVPPRPS